MHRQKVHPFAQSSRVELIDGEDAVTALRASWTADQPFATLACCAGERGVDDLHQLLVALRKWRWFHSCASISQSRKKGRQEAGPGGAVQPRNPNVRRA